MKSLTPPTRTPPRLPTPAEMDGMSGGAILEGLKELKEEERARDLREAISLGVRMAEEEALNWR